LLERFGDVREACPAIKLVLVPDANWLRRGNRYEYGRELDVTLDS